MDENTGNPTENGNGTPSVENTKSASVFDNEQQQVINSLIKKEKEKERNSILAKLGVSSVEDAKTKIDAFEELETYKEKASKFDEYTKKVADLEGENALLKYNITNEDTKDLVKNYFAGKNETLTSENLEKLFETKPAFKEMWLGKPKVEEQKPSVSFGNSDTNDNGVDDGYANFLKNTGRF